MHRSFAERQGILAQSVFDRYLASPLAACDSDYGMHATPNLPRPDQFQRVWRAAETIP